MQTPNVNLETIKTLVALHGQTRAAQISGLNLNTIKTWSRRYNWTNGAKLGRVTHPTQIERTLAIVNPKLNETSPSDLYLATIEQHKRTSKSNLARYVAEASGEAVNHKRKLSISRRAKDLADIHGSLFPEQTDSRNTILNLAIVTGQFKPLDRKPD